MDRSEFRKKLEKILMESNPQIEIKNEPIEDGVRPIYINNDGDFDLNTISFDNSYFKYGTMRSKLIFNVSQYISEVDEYVDLKTQELDMYLQQSHLLYAHVEKTKFSELHLQRMKEIEALLLDMKDHRRVKLMEKVWEHEKYLVDLCINEDYKKHINKSFNKIRLALNDLIDESFNDYSDEVNKVIRHEYEVYKKLF